MHSSVIFGKGERMVHRDIEDEWGMFDGIIGMWLEDVPKVMATQIHQKELCLSGIHFENDIKGEGEDRTSSKDHMQFRWTEYEFEDKFLGRFFMESKLPGQIRSPESVKTSILHDIDLCKMQYIHYSVKLYGELFDGFNQEVKLTEYYHMMALMFNVKKRRFELYNSYPWGTDKMDIFGGGGGNNNVHASVCRRAREFAFQFGMLFDFKFPVIVADGGNGPFSNIGLQTLFEDFIGLNEDLSGRCDIWSFFIMHHRIKDLTPDDDPNDLIKTIVGGGGGGGVKLGGKFSVSVNSDSASMAMIVYRKYKAFAKLLVDELMRKDEEEKDSSSAK